MIILLLLCVLLLFFVDLVELVEVRAFALAHLSTAFRDECDEISYRQCSTWTTVLSCEQVDTHTRTIPRIHTPIAFQIADRIRGHR